MFAPRIRVLLNAVVLAALVSVVACQTGGGVPAAPTAVQWPDNWPAPPLPVISLQHPDGPIQGDPHAYCWQFDWAASRVCEEETPWSGSYEYPEISPRQRIPVGIEAETKPTKLFALIFTKTGDMVVGNLRHLATVNPSLDLDLEPGEYNVRLIGYWHANEVSYEFGLIVPGEVELKAECHMSLVGVDSRVLLLESLDDRLRTAPDNRNRMGCRFNKPIASVVLTLHSDSLGSFTETFEIDPPSLAIRFPLRDNAVSRKTGGPLAAGEYSRRIVAFTEDGEEWRFDSGFLEEVVRISEP